MVQFKSLQQSLCKYYFYNGIKTKYNVYTKKFQDEEEISILAFSTTMSNYVEGS